LKPKSQTKLYYDLSSFKIHIIDRWIMTMVYILQKLRHLQLYIQQNKAYMLTDVKILDNLYPKWKSQLEPLCQLKPWNNTSIPVSLWACGVVTCNPVPLDGIQDLFWNKWTILMIHHFGIPSHSFCNSFHLLQHTNLISEYNRSFRP